MNDRQYSCFADAHGTELAWPMDATVALTLGSPAWPEAAAIEASLPQGSLVAGELLAGLDVGVAATSTGSILLESLAAEPFLIRFPLVR